MTRHRTLGWGLSLFFLFAALSVTSATGQEIRTLPHETLQGLTGVALIIEPVPIGGEARGLRTDTLRHDITSLLESSGLAVLTLEERRLTKRAPALYVQVSLFADGRAGLYAFHVRLALEQRVALRTESTQEATEAILAYATTWDRGATGTVAIDSIADLRMVVSDLTLQFIEAVR